MGFPLLFVFLKIITNYLVKHIQIILTTDSELIFTLCALFLVIYTSLFISTCQVPR